MADFNRKFKKPSILDMKEGNWDGDLNINKPEFYIKNISFGTDKLLKIEIRFEEEASLIDHSRTLTVDLTKIPVNARNKFRDLWDFVVDNIQKVDPYLIDGTEL